ncbi:MAG: hypothetical protein PHD03_01230 [Bacilli bacterium]|nr:hypothetical protein [Bacilli bacterium]MDD4406554.1 hypothetical protein [Bacilli bacterium]
MKNGVSSVKIFNIVLCVVILLIFVLTIGSRTKSEILTDSSFEVIPLSKQLGYQYPELSILSNDLFEESTDVFEEKEEIILDINYYLNLYKDTIAFFSNLFDYTYEDIINDLYLRNDNQLFEYTNIGNLRDEIGNINTYSSFEYGLIEYFYDLNNSNSKLRKVTYRPYTGNAEYIENLIIYYSSIYTNVDPITLLSIGAAESGYYKVEFMLKYNNVYGGMSSNGLIKHNNIEQGVLSYVRLMSINYYGKGLTTLSDIGRVYCPVYENDFKIARPHWINLVTNAKTKYENYTQTISINELNNIEKII